jgi:CheY-like chemotaxis protein
MGDGQVVLILNPAEMMTAPDDAKARRWTIPASPSGTNHAGDGITRAGNARKIMVVDDSVSVRSVISTLIEKTGWQPIAAKDGLEALEAIQRAAELPDLILLDIEMPRMDGYELITTLQSHDVYRKIPVVMLTSRAANKHRSRALELGASGYVTKPYQDDHLIQIIRELIESPKTE